jgi:hypothetical protein
MFGMELQDRLSLGFIWPMIPWDGSIVLVDFAIAFLPVEILADANPEPCNDLLGWDFGSVIPMIHVIDNLVAGIRGNPTSI